MNIDYILDKLQNMPRTTFGVSVPEIRKLALKIAREDDCILFDETNFETFELRLLNAFVLGYSRRGLPELLPLFSAFMPYVDDWAICDSLCQNFKVARKYPEEVWNFIMQYRNSSQEFEVRIVAVILLSHYLNDDYVDRVINVLDTLYAEKYYAQMGIAWALATVCGKYPQKCLNYLQNHNQLNQITFNMTKRKICESFRVSDEIKRQVKDLHK